MRAPIKDLQLAQNKAASKYLIKPSFNIFNIVSTDSEYERFHIVRYSQLYFQVIISIAMRSEAEIKLWFIIYQSLWA